MPIPALNHLTGTATVCEARDHMAAGLKKLPPHLFYYAADDTDHQLVEQCDGEHVYPKLLDGEYKSELGIIALDIKARVEMERQRVLSFFEEDDCDEGTMYCHFPIVHYHTMRVMRDLPIAEQNALVQVAFARRNKHLQKTLEIRRAKDWPTKRIEERIAYLEHRYEMLVKQMAGDALRIP